MRVPQAVERLVDEIEDDLWESLGAPPPLWITGEPGTGKSMALDMLHERSRRPVLRLSPSSADLDGPVNAIAQGAASLREHGANGALEPVFEARETFTAKLDAFGRELAKAEDSLILVDVPDKSWIRPSRLTKDGGTFALRGEQLIRTILRQRNGHRVVIASPQSPGSPEDPEPRRLHRGGGLQLLAGEFESGPFGAAAEQLRTLLPEAKLTRLTPLELRVAVALRALDVDPDVLRSACSGGWAMLRNALEIQIRRYPWLSEACLVLRQARISVGKTLLRRLLAPCSGPDEEPSRAILEHLLLLRETSGWVFHRRLHAIEPKVEPARARELTDGTNRTLAEAWARDAKPHTWAGLIAWWESLYHWAEAGEHSKLDQAPDVSMWTTLGRRLSLRGEYKAAVRAFSQAVEIQPEDSYAHEYLGYNLDCLGERRAEAERAFFKAVKLDPANPWWNRRLVQALQRRGKIEDARRAWLNALATIEDASEPSEWLQEHLHLGVCMGFLDRGEAELAEEVLSAVPRELWIDRFHGLFNVIQHHKEAEELEASLFPEELDFDTRWQGPHLGDDDDAPASWFPGRVVAVDHDADTIVLELAEPPAADEEPELFDLLLSIAEFNEQAGLSRRSRPSIDQFVELHVHDDDRQRIFFHPRPPRSKRSAPGIGELDLLDSFRP